MLPHIHVYINIYICKYSKLNIIPELIRMRTEDTKHVSGPRYIALVVGCILYTYIDAVYCIRIQHTSYIYCIRIYKIIFHGKIKSL